MSHESGIVANWFSADFPPDRAAELRVWSFDSIVEQLSNCQMEWLEWERASAEPLIVDPDIYDAFFNAPAGYRGEFAKSERHGEDAQRRIIEKLFPLLMEVAAQDPTAPRDHVITSLRGKQAKIWYDEDEASKDGPGSIDFPRWRDASNRGQRAPRGTKLEIKGGWVNAKGVQEIDPAKCHRSRYLTSFGIPG
jgi:hypothetical protein